MSFRSPVRIYVPKRAACDLVTGDFRFVEWFLEYNREDARVEFTGSADESDFVVLACPLTPETRHLINRETIKKIRNTSWLINIGRGAVVQETALIGALREKRIAGAMLDVYEHYRLEPGHPLFSLDNVILTPHLAAVTRESRARASVAAADEILRILRGEQPRNLVNPEVLRKATT